MHDHPPTSECQLQLEMQLHRARRRATATASTTTMSTTMMLTTRPRGLQLKMPLLARRGARAGRSSTARLPEDEDYKDNEVDDAVD